MKRGRADTQDAALTALRRDWEELAASDPLWAILSDPKKRGGGWSLAEFLETGRQEVDQLLTLGQSHGYPMNRSAALDFGCGVGRLTRALAGHFRSVTGIDISAGMIERARRLNKDIPNVQFIREERPRLPSLGDAVFDLVVSIFVLQHFPSDSLIRHVIAGLAARVDIGGLLILQLPAPLPLRHRFQPRPRAHAALRAAGIPEAVLRERLGLHSIRMRGMSATDVEAILTERGLTVQSIQTTTLGGSAMVSALYLASR